MYRMQYFNIQNYNSTLSGHLKLHLFNPLIVLVLAMHLSLNIDKALPYEFEAFRIAERPDIYQFVYIYLMSG